MTVRAWRWWLVAATVAVTTCAWPRPRPGGDPAQLTAELRRYNEYVRWDRVDLARPFVHPRAVTAFEAWSETTLPTYTFHDWHLRRLDVGTAGRAATAVVERVGYRRPRYVEERFTVHQRWDWSPNLGWRVRSGF